METLLFATSNPGKINELLALFSHDQVEIKTLRDLETTIPEPEETGTTFEENAILKARYYAKQSGLPTLADDSGLEVDALEKRPGVYSARYIEGSDADRSNKILQELDGVTSRQARFVCVLAFVPTSGEPSTFRGSCEGSIGFSIQGTQGFGYDPIFIPDGYTQSFGELGSEVKNTLSHRHKAMEAFSTWYRKQL